MYLGVRELIDCGKQAGFRFESMGYLVKDLRNILERHWDKLKEKMHIEIPQSTSLFCVADPTGTLKEGEVSLHFSQGLIDERTGRPRHTIQGEILVARNPALLPTDIQKVTAVDNRKLRELKDVIVFSTKGDKSLASLLSGGDYDGDKVCSPLRWLQLRSNCPKVLDLLGPTNCYAFCERKPRTTPVSRS